VHLFEKKFFKVFSLERPHKNVWGPCQNVSLGPAVALDEPEFIHLLMATFKDLHIENSKNYKR